jgi:hypothetical protein
MWPFKGKQEIGATEAQVAQFRSFRNVGQKFNYLGRTCIVTEINHCPLVLAQAYLYADYVDDAGVIHRTRFFFDELPALKAENGEAA